MVSKMNFTDLAVIIYLKSKRDVKNRRKQVVLVNNLNNLAK
jgi:hypothetical protein